MSKQKPGEAGVSEGARRATGEASRVAVEDEETCRLKNVVADLATEKDLLKEKVRHLDDSATGCCRRLA